MWMRRLLLIFAYKIPKYAVVGGLKELQFLRSYLRVLYAFFVMIYWFFFAGKIGVIATWAPKALGPVELF